MRGFRLKKNVEQPNRILEVWFPGVHSDIGGGYWLDGLSDLTLEFMIGECRKGSATASEFTMETKDHYRSCFTRRAVFFPASRLTTS